ncbi:MAG TPA: hypothetical protein PKZ16_00110 [bacterium]|nr:hypothetical protein [bacterium]HPL95607.1 hypothetical protein [bacterium]
MYNFKQPKNNDKFFWTKHSLEKMKFYGLSPQRVLRIINHPERVEEAVAPGCLAGMQSMGNNRKTEIWVMWKEKVTRPSRKPACWRCGQESQKLKVKNMNLNKQKLIITAWRYPGVSPIRVVPVPEDILKELGEIIN